LIVIFSFCFLQRLTVLSVFVAVGQGMQHLDTYQEGAGHQEEWAHHVKTPGGLAVRQVNCYFSFSFLFWVQHPGAVVLFLSSS